MEKQSKKLQRTKKDKDISTKVSVLKPERLRIGKWKFEPTNEGDELLVKFFFVTKQLALEVSKNGCRQKIEIEWSNIVGIRATLKENQQETLDVELLCPPKFYKELQIDVRTHNKWVDGSDFTEDQASQRRRYLIAFPPGVLSEDFARLTNSDKRLCKLSQSPYPTIELAYFPSHTLLNAIQIIQPSNQTLQLSRGADNLVPQTPDSKEMMRLQQNLTTRYELQQPQPTISSEEALQILGMPMIGRSNNFQMASSSSMPQYSQVLNGDPNEDPNGHSLVWGSLSNRPINSNGVSNNECLWNAPTNSNRASNDYLLNMPINSNGVSNGCLLNGPRNSNGVLNAHVLNGSTHFIGASNYRLSNEPTNSNGGNGHLLNESSYFIAVSNDCLPNGPTMDSNGVSNGHMLNGPTHDSIGASNYRLSNEPTNYNGPSNDYSLNGPTNSNGLSNGHLLNVPIDYNRVSNGHMLNGPIYSIGASNYHLSNEPTNSNGGNDHLLNGSWYFNGVSNDSLLNGPTCSNVVSNDHFYNIRPTNSNGASNDRLFNDSTYSIGVSKDYFSNLPTDSHGVWLPPPPPQSKKED